NSWGSTVSTDGRLKLITIFPESASFRIASLGTSNSKVAEDRNLIGYENGGIALSSSRLLYTGSYGTEGFDLENLANPIVANRYEVLASDLRTGTPYVFARTNIPTTYYTMATH